MYVILIFEYVFLLLCSYVALTTLSVCRWFETHHQAEALGPAGGADWQVRVAPRRSWVLRWLPDSHAGADPGKESHGRRMLAPPLDRPLVETSSHCTSPPSYSLQRLQQITFQFGHIRWIFISPFVFSLFWISHVLVLELMLLCTFALYLFSVWWRRESSGLYYFVVMLAPTAVLHSPTQLSKPVIVLLVTHPCLLHSCTKTQTNQGYVAFIGHFCPLKRTRYHFFSRTFSLVLCFF